MSDAQDLFAELGETPRLTAERLVELIDPDALLEENGRYLRSVSFRAPEDADPVLVAPILREAAARQAEM